MIDLLRNFGEKKDLYSSNPILGIFWPHFIIVKLGSLYIWLSMYMEDWIDQLKTGMISFCAILFVMLTSIHVLLKLF